MSVTKNILSSSQSNDCHNVVVKFASDKIELPAEMAEQTLQISSFETLLQAKINEVTAQIEAYETDEIAKQSAAAESEATDA